jgi:hypothetical protein
MIQFSPHSRDWNMKFGRHLLSEFEAPGEPMILKVNNGDADHIALPVVSPY